MMQQLGRVARPAEAAYDRIEDLLSADPDLPNGPKLAILWLWRQARRLGQVSLDINANMLAAGCGATDSRTARAWIDQLLAAGLIEVRGKRMGGNVPIWLVDPREQLRRVAADPQRLLPPLEDLDEEPAGEDAADEAEIFAQESPDAQRASRAQNSPDVFAQKDPEICAQKSPLRKPAAANDLAASAEICAQKSPLRSRVRVLEGNARALTDRLTDDDEESNYQEQENTSSSSSVFESVGQSWDKARARETYGEVVRELWPHRQEKLKQSTHRLLMGACLLAQEPLSLDWLWDSVRKTKRRAKSNPEYFLRRCLESGCAEIEYKCSIQHAPEYFAGLMLRVAEYYEKSRSPPAAG